MCRYDSGLHDEFICGLFSPLSRTAALMFSGSGGTMGPSPCHSFMIESSRPATATLGKIAMVKSVERIVPIASSLLDCEILLGTQYQGLNTWKSGCGRWRKSKQGGHRCWCVDFKRLELSDMPWLLLPPPDMKSSPPTSAIAWLYSDRTSSIRNCSVPSELSTTT